VYQSLINKEKSIAVIGLGYVGLPLALEFAKKFKVIGFDINESRVALMKQSIDPSGELESKDFQNKDIVFTTNRERLKNAHFFIIAVPTDIDEFKVPNLTPLKKASEMVGKALKKGDYVVYESTVYPGCTEEDCLPLLESNSGLVASIVGREKMETNFKLGYSPERIVPGDKVRTLSKILKIVAGGDTESAIEIAQVYDEIIEPGTYKASSIKVAEAAKVIENTQRDLNISLMNELSMIFDRIGIDTKEVIDAAGTKWNFNKYYPGLVGGHCIGVDPYYLLHKAREVGYEPQVIASGRRINDEMPAFISKRLVQSLIQKGKNPSHCKILVLGITFKENVSDIRNSKIVDLIRDLMGYSINVQIFDPWASPNEIAHEYKLTLTEKVTGDYDAVIAAVPHQEFENFETGYFKSIMKNDPILYDLKGIYAKEMDGIEIWRL
jgi:UDP-N-acetyl-D-glucosamine/UDP-N-acetyl-D-galactosamine dehydrogenase